MATFTATRAAANFPGPAQSHAGLSVQCSYGTIAVAANPTAADIYEMSRLPRGAVVLGGYLIADDMDTGIETLDMDWGWLANGQEALDADGFGNLGVWTADAVTDVRPETYIRYEMGGVFKDGPITFTAETIVAVTCVVTAATFAAGDLSTYVMYITP